MRATKVIYWYGGDKGICLNVSFQNLDIILFFFFVFFLLQIPSLKKEYFGNFTCKVANILGYTNKTFTLDEGVLPSAPLVNVREVLSNAFRFDILPSNNTQELHNYRVEYRKVEDNRTKTLDLELSKRVLLIPRARCVLIKGGG